MGFPAPPDPGPHEFSVSGFTMSSELMPLPSGQLASPRRQSRSEVREMVRAGFATAAAPGAARTLEASFRPIAPKPVARFSASVLPMGREL